VQKNKPSLQEATKQTVNPQAGSAAAPDLARQDGTWLVVAMDQAGDASCRQSLFFLGHCRLKSAPMRLSRPGVA